MAKCGWCTAFAAMGDLSTGAHGLAIETAPLRVELALWVASGYNDRREKRISTSQLQAEFVSTHIWATFVETEQYRKQPSDSVSLSY